MKITNSLPMFVLLAAIGSAQAALVDRGGGMIYDTALKITWLSDWNYAQTQYIATAGAQGDADGKMNWAAANSWANGLTYAGFSDWRLPTITQPDPSCNNSFDPGGGVGIQYFGFGCTSGEMGHMFYVDLGRKPGESILTSPAGTPQQAANFSLFSNVQSSVYWSGTVLEPPGTNYAWRFIAFDGNQGLDDRDLAWYALAVRTGDVIASVPEPQSYSMLLLGLIVLLRKKRRE
jgi:hypothetical protein